MLFPVTLDVSGDVLGESMIGELVAIIASCINDKVGNTLLSGASRLVVLLIGVRVVEGSRFGAFRFYLLLRLVGPSLLGVVDLGAGEL